MMRITKILFALLLAMLPGCAGFMDGDGGVDSVAATPDGNFVATSGHTRHLLSVPENIKGGTISGVKLLLSSRKGGFLYVLMDVTRPPAEVSAVWLKINPAWQVVAAKTALHDSSRIGRHTDTDYYALTAEHLWMTYKDAKTVYTLNYDSTYPEPGFVVVEVPVR